MATATESEYNLLLQWQVGVRAEQGTWKDFRNGACVQQDLHVFGWMKDGLMDIQVDNYVAKFTSIRESQELFRKLIEFLGDRDDYVN